MKCNELYGRTTVKVNATPKTLHVNGSMLQTKQSNMYSSWRLRNMQSVNKWVKLFVTMKVHLLTPGEIDALRLLVDKFHECSRIETRRMPRKKKKKFKRIANMMITQIVYEYVKDHVKVEITKISKEEP
jgi:hypothetical protein